MSELSRSDRWALVFFFATAALGLFAWAFPNMTRLLTIPGAVICLLFAIYFARPEFQNLSTWIKGFRLARDRSFIPIGLVALIAIALPSGVLWYAQTKNAQPPETAEDLPSAIFSFNYESHTFAEVSRHQISNINIQEDSLNLLNPDVTLTISFSQPVVGKYSLYATYKAFDGIEEPILISDIKQQNSDYVIVSLSPPLLTFGLKSTEITLAIVRP